MPSLYLSGCYNAVEFFLRKTNNNRMNAKALRNSNPVSMTSKKTKKYHTDNDDDDDKNRHCCLTVESCESTVTMRLRCRRAQLISVVVALLLVISVTTNASLMRKFNRQLMLDNNLSGRKLALNGLSPANTATALARLKRKNRKVVKRKRTVKTTPVIKPRPESLQENATFAACLLIKDDNEILNEWLAYHYFVLNLRTLIVAVDPLSTESPSNILRKWRLMTDLEVSQWTDVSYMPKEFIETKEPPSKYMQKPEDFSYNISNTALLEISNHRYRQRVFLAKCMTKLRKEGHSWMAHIDTDEFIVASKLLRQIQPENLKVAPMDTPGSVMKLIQEVTAKTPIMVSYPCLSLLRVLFGSVESTNEERTKGVPAGFDSDRFETLRWRHHALPHNMSLHGNPKVILDVAAIPEEYFPKDVVYSIHRPVTAYCKKNKEVAFTNFRRQPLGANHYLGSWERYSRRADKRRSRAVYDEKADQRQGTDDGVRPWLRGFVRMMGARVAVKLLGDEYLANEFKDDYKNLHTIYRGDYQDKDKGNLNVTTMENIEFKMISLPPSNITQSTHLNGPSLIHLNGSSSIHLNGSSSILSSS